MNDKRSHARGREVTQGGGPKREIVQSEGMLVAEEYF